MLPVVVITHDADGMSAQASLHGSLGQRHEAMFHRLGFAPALVHQDVGNERTMFMQPVPRVRDRCPRLNIIQAHERGYTKLLGISLRRRRRVVWERGIRPFSLATNSSITKNFLGCPQVCAFDVSPAILFLAPVI